MTEQDYWDSPNGAAGSQEPPIVGSSQPTQAFRSGTTDAMPPIDERDYQQANTPPSHGYQYRSSTSPKEKKSGSGLKTFLFGFLGALVACALALGGFTAWQSTQRTQSSLGNTSQSATALGSTDQSIINATDEGQTLAEAVAAKALPSVAYIGVYSSQSSYTMYGFGTSSQDSSELTETALGSGIVLSEDGYILTNYHVIESAEAVKVTIEGTEYNAEIVGTDSSSDLAVIKAQNASGLTPADIGDSDSLVVGEWVMSVGCPFGLEQSVATGVVSATSRSRVVDESSNSYGYGTSQPTLYPNMIQTDAAINPGNSGGALVDANGKVIGVNTLIASYSGNYSGVGFAIPINYAINIAQQIIDGETPTHARLGVSLTDVNSSNAKRYNLPVDYGAYVTDVAADSGADAAGVKVEDIIIEFDGEKVTTSTDLTLDVRAHNPGDTVTMKVNRAGQEIELEVTLGSDEQQLIAQEQEMNDGYSQQNPHGSGNDSGNGGYSYEDLLKYFGLL